MDQPKGGRRYVMDEKLMDLIERMGANDREHEAFNRRLKEHDARLQQTTQILVAIQRQGDALETLSTKIGEMDGTLKNVAARVSKIEQEPGEKWKKIAFEIVKYLVLAAVGVAAGYIIKG